jgi:hypothetical protein
MFRPSDPIVAVRRPPALAPSDHVFRVERKCGPVWYAKYRLPDRRQVQKKLGPAWTGRGRPPADCFTRRLAEDALRQILDHARKARCQDSSTHARDACRGGPRVPALRRAGPAAQALDRPGLPLADRRADLADPRSVPAGGRDDGAGAAVVREPDRQAELGDRINASSVTLATPRRRTVPSPLPRRRRVGAAAEGAAPRPCDTQASP